MQSIGKVFPCPECEKSFKRKDGLKNHMRVHTKEKPFSCSVCGNAFSWKSHFDRHMLRHTNEKPFICCRCGRGFGYKAILDMHMRTHTKEKPYACSLCGKRFSQQGAMRVHERTHSDERPFTCGKCSLSFKHRNGLTKHMRVHLQERPFSCSICEKSFRDRSHLRTHMLIHTNIKPYSCSVCGKSFNIKSNLKIHERGHRHEKPFACDECGKCFARKDVLILHLRLHAKEKLFSCRECKICFRLKSAWGKHMMKMHSEDRALWSNGREDSNLVTQSAAVMNSIQNRTNFISQDEKFASGSFTLEKQECSDDYSTEAAMSCDELVTVKEECVPFESGCDKEHVSLTLKEERTKSDDENGGQHTGEYTSSESDTVNKCTTLGHGHVDEYNFDSSGTSQSVLSLTDFDVLGEEKISSENKHFEVQETEETKSSFLSVWTGLI